jgi:hypothetical protein
MLIQYTSIDHGHVLGITDHPRHSTAVYISANEGSCAIFVDLQCARIHQVRISTTLRPLPSSRSSMISSSSSSSTADTIPSISGLERLPLTRRRRNDHRKTGTTVLSWADTQCPALVEFAPNSASECRVVADTLTGLGPAVAVPVVPVRFS